MYLLLGLFEGSVGLRHYCILISSVFVLDINNPLALCSASTDLDFSCRMGLCPLLIC